MKINRQRLKTILLESGKANNSQLSEAERLADNTNQPFDSILISKKIVGEKEIYKLLADSVGVPFIDLENKSIPRDILLRVPERIAKKYQAVLFGEEAGKMLLAMADPEDYEAQEVISKQIGYRVKIYAATPSDLASALEQYKEGLSQEITAAIKESELEKDQFAEHEVSEEEMDIQQVADAPIAKAVNIILGYAVKQRATDIHIEPRETFIQVRYRVDGILREAMTLPKNLLPPVVSRIKILSDLKIDEHRLPQDGRIKIRVAGRVFGVRVSILPTIYGEKVVMRLLEETAKAATLEDLGFQGTSLDITYRAIKKPHGIIFVTGPTGSGKTTTLYSIISYLNNPGVNISTIEDPVEYHIPGANQVQLNLKAGMTFAVGLRSLLRQDPNIMMIGEIRDKETLEIAIHAALTGHVVLTTLHTNNAASASPRLLDMGAEPFLIASTLNAVLGQRLVRKLCENCKKPYELSQSEVDALKKTFDVDRALSFLNQGALTSHEAIPQSKTKMGDKKVIPGPRTANDFEKKSILERIAANPNIIHTSLAEAEIEQKSKHKGKKKESKSEKPSSAITLWKPSGCPKCGDTGYIGRLGIYEAIEGSQTVQQLIVKGSTADDIQNEAIKTQNMMTMQVDGFIKCLMGITTVEEVLRVTRE